MITDPNPLNPHVHWPKLTPNAMNPNNGLSAKNNWA